MTELTSALLRTREARAALRAALPELLAAWAGASRLRSVLARAATPLLAGGFDPADSSTSLDEVLSDPQRLAEMMFPLLGSAPAAARTVTVALARLPAEERARLLEGLLDAVDWREMGALVGDLVRLAAASRGGDPEASAEWLRRPLAALVEAVDFGDLKEALEAGAESAVAATAVVNEELWRYPAKALCLLSTAPVLASAGARAAARTVAPVNELAPDLVADVLLSLVRRLGAADLAALLDQLAELVRKVHTGGALIGEGASSRLPADLADQVCAVLGAADLAALLKARALVAETVEATEALVLERLADHPELARELVAAGPRAAAGRVRRLGRRLEAIGCALGDDAIAAELTASLATVDAQALADVVTTVLGHLERVERHGPGTVGGLLAQVLGGLDPAALRVAARRLSAELVAALEPVAAEVLPPVVLGLADLVSSTRHDPEMQDALVALRAALEVKR